VYGTQLEAEREDDGKVRAKTITDRQPAKMSAGLKPGGAREKRLAGAMPQISAPVESTSFLIRFEFKTGDFFGNVDIRPGEGIGWLVLML
jgi:hypothetical protein